MAIATNLGYPRIGQKRELKWALEKFWKGSISKQDLLEKSASIRQENWREQQAAGIQHIPSNDFSFYDHVLDTALMVGAIPQRYIQADQDFSLETYFAMARGIQNQDKNLRALEMTKWFDTNYHYIVPELSKDQEFTLTSTKVFDEFQEAQKQGITTRPVILGPLSFLLLSKSQTDDFQPIELLEKLVPVYEEVLRKLNSLGAEWVQIDEPCLCLDLEASVLEAYSKTYAQLAKAASDLKILLTSYFGSYGKNLATVVSLPVAGIHLDGVRAADELDALLEQLPEEKFLSLGVVDGRNVWRNDFKASLGLLEKASQVRGKEKLMVAPSCSLFLSPVNLELEAKLDGELQSWLAFAKQKLTEIVTLTQGLEEGQASIAQALESNQSAIESRRSSPRIHNQDVKNRMGALEETMFKRTSGYAERQKQQAENMNLPLFPTTTIGSFPQTKAVRALRAEYKKGKRDLESYEQALKTELENTIRFQEEVGLDMLVHGEFERNDMVEYFGELMEGFAFTEYGWVQSYGSRCVKPPIIFGDVYRKEPMTLRWTQYAQSLTEKPVKGMLTGPVTILQWSFVRNDQARSETAFQIGLAIRDEVVDLEKGGVKAIQIDEPAFREGLPLRKKDWGAYLKWAVEAFRLSSCGVQDATQIHTHMCYSEFNDIIESIADLDADVMSIETSRSNMELLEAFTRFDYPNEIGPGVYDIHSPRIPSREEMKNLLQKAKEVLRPTQIWVNPDCGLKTRGWEEVRPALQEMVLAAQELRQETEVSSSS